MKTSILSIVVLTILGLSCSKERELSDKQLESNIVISKSREEINTLPINGTWDGSDCPSITKTNCFVQASISNLSFEKLDKAINSGTKFVEAFFNSYGDEFHQYLGDEYIGFLKNGVYTMINYYNTNRERTFYLIGPKDNLTLNNPVYVFSPRPQN